MYFFGLKEFSHLEFVKEARNIANKMSIKDEMLKRQEWVDRVVPKLMMVSNLISDTSWNEDYKANTHRFMNSLIKQAKTRKTLSKKQMDSASSIYARVKKNIKKNEKKT